MFFWTQFAAEEILTMRSMEAFGMPTMTSMFDPRRASNIVVLGL